MSDHKLTASLLSLAFPDPEFPEHRTYALTHKHGTHPVPQHGKDKYLYGTVVSTPTDPAPATPSELSEFIRAYKVCMLWSSTTCDEQGNNCRNLDDDYDIDDIAPEAAAEIGEDCEDFIAGNILYLRRALRHPGYTWESAGHDFWLTRCGHGAGFWDRGLPGNTGDRLSEASRIYGNIDPYAGDDGLIYIS